MSFGYKQIAQTFLADFLVERGEAVIRLLNSVAAWGTPDFENVLKDEIQNIEPDLLPLQAGLSQSSYVSDSDISVLVLNVTETADDIHAKTNVFYAGIIAGSCCADDPTPICEQTECCEMQFAINKLTAETTVTLVNG